MLIIVMICVYQHKVMKQAKSAFTIFGLIHWIYIVIFTLLQSKKK